MINCTALDQSKLSNFVECTINKSIFKTFCIYKLYSMTLGFGTCSRRIRSINKIAPGFPVAEHFSSNGHTAADALVRGIKLCEGNKQRKRQEMRLIFRLGTCQPRGLNADFQFI